MEAPASGGEITNISGTFTGLNITTLLSLNDFGGNDNLLSYPTEPFLTLGGVSFSLSDGNQINIFFGDPVYGAQDLIGRNLNAGTFSVPLRQRRPRCLLHFHSSPPASAA